MSVASTECITSARVAVCCLGAFHRLGGDRLSIHSRVKRLRATYGSVTDSLQLAGGGQTLCTHPMSLESPPTERRKSSVILPPYNSWEGLRASVGMSS